MLQPEQILRDRYQLKQQLGQNAARQTWLAEDLQSQNKERIIIKLLAFNPQMQWEELKLFEREAQILQHLDCPYIPKYRDYFTVDKESGFGLPWFGLVQDYIPGSSLQKILEKGKKFNQLETREIAKQILNILIYLHELSPPVIHRDIKPSNLILGTDGQVYLVDFGAVQDKAKAEGMTFTVVGTSGYAPPEQLWGKTIPNSDLYALGATLIHLLTGIAPCDLPHRQMRIEFRDKVKLSFYFANWLEKLTQPASERRFNTARSALENLQESVNSRTDFQLPIGSVNYGRLAFLSFCGLALGSIPIGMIIYDIQARQTWDIKYQQLQGKQNVLYMNKSQAAYYLQNGKFVVKDTSKGWADLAVWIQTKTTDYKFSFNSTSTASYNYATSHNNSLRSYVGGVFIVPIEGGGAIPQTILCEANNPGQFIIAKPVYKKEIIACGNGTHEISQY